MACAGVHLRLGLLFAALITCLCGLAQTHEAASEPFTQLPVATVQKICPRKQSSLTLRIQSCPLASDDTSNPTSWAPWAYRPRCILQNLRGRWVKLDDDDDGNETDEASNKPAGEPDVRQKYCLFTNTYFGDYGVSLLARPAAAADAATTLLEGYHSTFPSAETVQHLRLEPPAYEVVDMPEKGGKGVVATRKIKRKETFLVDFAAISGDVDMWGSVAQEQGRLLLDLAADQLVDPDLVLTLSGRENAGMVEGIISVNTFRTYLNDVPQKALFPRISRINHACKPNSMIRFSENGLMAGVAAFRDIEPGEEITVSYISLTDTSEQREGKLNSWGFSCSCELCTAPIKHIEESDNRREKIAKGVELMVAALQKGDVRGAITTLVETLKHFEEEGLEALSGEIYEGLARIYWAVGEKKTAKDLARKAVEYRGDFGGGLAPVDHVAELEKILVAFDA